MTAKNKENHDHSDPSNNPFSVYRSVDVPREKTLFDVLGDVWAARIYIMICVLLSAIAAQGFMMVATPYYRAQMIIAPAPQMHFSAREGAGMPEGTIQIQNNERSADHLFLRFEATYNGLSTAAILMKDRHIQEILSKDRRFDFSAAPDFGENTDLFTEYLQKRVHLVPVSGTHLRKLVYLHPNPDDARYVLGRIHTITDEIIRARILSETNERIRYLGGMLSQVNHPDHRRSLAALLMEQERIKMMVSLDQPYAATVIEPPFSSGRAAWPDRYLLFAVFIFIGFLSGFVLHGIRHHE